MNAGRVIGAAFRRLQRRRMERAQQLRRASYQSSYHAIVDGRPLSSAESEHLFRVLLFAGETPLGADTEQHA